MLKNEYRNREYTMADKNHYYSESISHRVLNPTVQFKIRKMMDEKLAHRLKICKDQAKNFGALLENLKSSRTPICQALQ